VSIIEDGTGKGVNAGVTSNNELQTIATTKNNLTNIGLNGGGWTVATSTIALTSASTSAVAYVKNDGDIGLVLRELSITSEPSNESAGTNNQKQTYVLEIDAVIVTENLPTTITPISIRSTEEQDLSATIKQGVEGSAVTSGATISTYHLPGGQLTQIANGDGLFFLEPDATIALKITPPAGNTAMDFSLIATIFKNDGTL